MPRSRPAVVALLVALGVAGALVTYKASAALTTLSVVDRTGTLAARAPWLGGEALAILASYFATVWIALSFGLVLGAAVKVLIPGAWVRRALGGGPAGVMRAGLLGAPLMLCSCCVAPIFDGAYARTGRLGPAVALLLAAPSLNPFALVLTVMLFPAPIAIARLVGAALIVAMAGFLPEPAAPPVCAPTEEPPPTARAFLIALNEVAWRTLPAIALGVLGSALLAEVAPVASLALAPRLAMVLLVVAVGVLVALPTFAEIPLALGLLAAGAPSGAAVALLIAGPAVNLPSLLTIARSASARGALQTGLWVAAVALVAGLALELAAA
jgi:uncharacterized membrane protein YraQ (UPF0718 family)